MDNRIKLIEKIKIKLKGYVISDSVKQTGWKEPSTVYTFKCPKHGYVKNYARGHNERLECPKCLEEQMLISIRKES